ncbi:hypothetical protein FRC14_007507 [Serendipita sp. 396]|nr:hypothetical protein FRC14_007507 [Serendipita sp. 396]
MENITFLSSGALNRAHYALVAKQERALSPEEADKAAWDVIEEVKNRMIRRPVETITSSIGDLFAAGARGWGFNIPYSNAVWNSRQAREDLLLLLYCQDSLTTEKRSVSSHGLFFALPTALTLAEAGTTVEQRRTGYLFCSQVLPLGHEMQLLVINTVGKHLDSPSIPNILLALDYLINAPNSDAIPAINSRLQDLLAHKSPQVRQRVMHAFRVLAVLDSDLLFRCKAGLQLNMQNADPIVRGAALSLLLACFENNVVDSAFVEATILEVIQKFRPSKANVPSIRLTTKAVEILGKTLNKLELNLQNAAIALFGLATKAGSRGIWSLALAAFRVLSQIPQEICIKALALKDDASRPLNNSLYFLKPLLRQVDLNLVSLLLQCLVLLPPIIWTGGSVGTAESKKMTTDGHTKGSLPDDMDANELFGEEAGKSAEGEAFPEDKVSASITFPSLFSEEEVGTIVSFLKSKDIMIRKLTILVLSRADPLESGIVYQYYHQMLDRLSSNDTTVGIQTDLASQALEVAEVLCYDDPMVYASLVTEILSRADTLIGKTEVASPTLSSRSGVSTSTQQTRGRGDEGFSLKFSEALSVEINSGQRNGPIPVSILVITAACACEQRNLSKSVSQQLLDKFAEILPSTSTAVQEALLLAMIRLSTVEGINLDVSMKSIRSLQHSTRRRIRERCLQYLDHMANLPKLTAKVAALTSSTIPDVLSVLEPVHYPSPPESTERAVEGINPYHRHDRQSSTPTHSKDTGLFVSKSLHNHRSGSITGQDSELIQLGLLRSSSTGLAQATESIPEILHGSSSFAFHPPPFLSRNKSPPSSPATSPRRVILPTPRSPDPGTPIRGSPASRTIQLQATRGTQDSVIGFDINWDRLGAQAGLTSRGWFEGSTDRLLRKFEGNKGILRVETVSQDGTGKTFYSYKPPPNHE